MLRELRKGVGLAGNDTISCGFAEVGSHGLAAAPGAGPDCAQEARMKRILFVCVENSNRSQIAEAFVRIHGGDRVEAASAGSRPSGTINPKAVAAMRELGYDLTRHESKSVDAFRGQQFDATVTMGCGDACPAVLAAQRFDWQIPDPRDMAPEEFRQVRDLIEARVKQLLAML